VCLDHHRAALRPKTGTHHRHGLHILGVLSELNPCVIVDKSALKQLVHDSKRRAGKWKHCLNAVDAHRGFNSYDLRGFHPEGYGQTTVLVLPEGCTEAHTITLYTEKHHPDKHTLQLRYYVREGELEQIWAHVTGEDVPPPYVREVRLTSHAPAITCDARHYKSSKLFVAAHS